ncbi:class I SAM-dependent methyltransferase [Actinoplanes sp. CA-142083]|uniref:class I SAM-dependent methyltransferase n=1 Tax=Actinoplanes sp. CA-142083 TaxID=3239903 RepID=UPI003D8A4C97
MTAAPRPASDILDAARSALVAHQLAVTGTDDQVIRLPEAATTELMRELRQTARSVYQMVPFPGRTNAIDLFSLLVWRQHALDGNDVRRLYLVPFGCPDADRVSLQVQDDFGSRINAHFVNVNGGAEEGDQPIPLTNIWIVDDQVVIYEEHGDSGPPTWVVSARAEDLHTAKERWRKLWDRSEDVREAPRVSEPLLESADMLYSIAQFACTGDHVDRESCTWYHGVWQYLRLFNMVSSPNWHARFYEQALRRELGGRRTARVLITGAADYGMLAYVLAAVDPTTRLEVHVVDLCYTPLLANRWLGKRLGVDVKIHNVDFLADGEQLAKSLDPFDLIVSDAFLTRFKPPDARQVVANWRRMLRPGGAVVTTVRLRDDTQPATDAWSDLHTDFLLRLYERAKNSHWLLRIDFNDLRNGAREYIRKMESNDLGGEEEIGSILAGEGFRVSRTVERVDGELAPTTYLRVVCRA